MELEDLKSALKLAAPCLQTNDFIPAFSHVCFCGDDGLYAFNDVAAIIVGFPTELSIGLQGDALIGVLEASKAKSVDIEIKDKIAVLKLDGGSVKLPVLPEDDFVFELPDEAPNITLDLDENIIAALERCLLCVSDNALKQNLNGITVIASKKHGAAFYSSNNITAACADAIGAEGDGHAIIPKNTCELLLNLNKTLETETMPQLMLGDSYAIATFDCEPSVTLVSKLIRDDPAAFEKMFSGFLYGGSTYPIPEELQGELAKANVLLSRDLEKKCVLSQSGGELSISADGQLGELRGTMKVKGKQPARMTGFQPEQMMRALPYCTEMEITESHLTVMTGENFTYAISGFPVKANTATAPKLSTTSGKDKPRKDSIDDDIPF